MIGYLSIKSGPSLLKYGVNTALLNKHWILFNHDLLFQARNVKPYTHNTEYVQLFNHKML